MYLHVLLRLRVDRRHYELAAARSCNPMEHIEAMVLQTILNGHWWWRHLKEIPHAAGMIGLDLVECEPTWCGNFSAVNSVASCATAVHILEPEFASSTGINRFLLGTANPLRHPLAAERLVRPVAEP